MTLPATIAVATAAIDLLFGLLVLGISTSPGWRHYRWFAAAAFLACVYSFTEVWLTLPAPDEVIAWASRLALVSGGLHGLCWVPFTARIADRPLSWFDRALMAGAVVFSVLCLIPGVLVTSQVTGLGVEIVGAVYRDAVPTTLGSVCFGYYCFGLLVIAIRLGRHAMRGHRETWPQFFAFLILLAAATSDSLTASRVWSLPYLLNVGFLSVVVATCSMVVLRFGANARALEESTRKLKETQEKLVARERLAALGELSAVIAHEVRNPLGVIYNAVAQLRRSIKKDDLNAPVVNMLQEEAERLNRMVASLLEFSRPEDVTLRQTRLLDLLLSAARSAVSATGADAREIEVDCAEKESLWCDRQMMQQAVINLLENALVAPRRKGPVQLRAERRDGQLRLMVADDGAGVAPGQEDRIFTPFFTTRARGTGLGLAVVRRVAEAHGGTATVEPTPGGGATFVIALPRHEYSSTAA